MWTAKCDFNKEYYVLLIKISTSIISFFSSYEIAVGKNVKQQPQQTCLQVLSCTVHHFHSRVKSPICTAYGKYLPESITAVLTLKSGIGLNGIILLTSPMYSSVIGRESIIPSASINNVWRDFSLRLSPWFLSIAERILPAEQICLSHTPPILLVMGRLRFQLILHQKKLVPPSLWIILTFPLLLINHLSAWMKLSVVKLLVISMCTAMLDKHITIIPYLF